MGHDKEGRIARLGMVAAAAAFVCTGGVAQTADASPEGLSIHGGVSYGVSARSSDPSPELLFVNNAPAAGLTSTNTAGRNQDDGNMNYRKGDVVSNVVKGFANLGLRKDATAAQLGIQGWHDFELTEGDVPWGHTPNGLRANSPLSDEAARPRGKFSNVVVSQAWVRHSFATGKGPVAVTLGQQTIGWRGMGLAPGPLAVLDPADFIARTRPGAFAEETSIPIPALRASFAAMPDVTVDAFYQLAFRANQTPLCGTFFAAVDRTLDGCDKTMVNAGAGTLSDRALLAAHRYVQLGPVNDPGDAGQFGVSTRWKLGGQTEIGAAFARYHSRSSFTNMVKSLITGGNPFSPDDPRNPQTQVVYPKGIETVALDFRHAAAGTTVYGSVGFTPNQPLAYPGGEIFQAFVAPVANASLFRAQERATAPGGVFQGWDRRRTSDWQAGVIKPLKDVAGAATLALRAELNAKFVHNLPDPTQLRYGRAEVYGIGPINGTCAAGSSAITCTNDGYVSKSAWGYALQAVATYPKALAGIDLRPRVNFVHNVRGWSYDGSLREGRKSWVAGVDAIYKQTTFSIGFVRHGGGNYDNTTDRDYVSASIATRF